MRTVNLKLRVETDASVEDLKACITDALTDMVGMRDCSRVTVESIEADVIKKRKHASA